MRLPLIAALVIASTPAATLAQDADAAPLGEAVERLADPELQQQAGLTATLLATMLLEMRVGPLAEALEQFSGEELDIDPDAQVADLAGADSEQLAQRLGEQVPQMMGAVAGMGGAIEEMLPQMRALAERMRASMAEER